jgi:hypothetical protein
LKKLRLFFGILLIGLGIYLAFYHADYSSESIGRIPNSHEVYDPSLAHISDLKTAESYIDSVYTSRHSHFDSFLYLQVTKEFVENKFYHGNAEYSWRENWICWVLGKTIWSHFNSKVASKDVIKHSQAMCSEQTMVFTNLMSKKGFSYRYAYLFSKTRGHFCCEIWQGSEWHFVDVDMEPQWDKIKGPSNISIEKAIKNNCLEKIYDSSYACIKEVTHFKPRVKYEEANKELGVRMKWFQSITSYLSYLLLISLGIFLILFSVRK